MLFTNLGQRATFLDSFEAALRAREPGPITFHEAYLEDSRSDYQSYLESQADTLRRRYSGLKLDVVILVGPAALQFALQYRSTIFPGVPLAFLGLATRQFAGQTWPGVTGLTTPVGLGETIDLALRLHPDTTTVAVIAPLAGVPRKLIEAQEAERTHIARELHDDINQRIALLALNLHMLRKKLPASQSGPGNSRRRAGRRS